MARAKKAQGSSLLELLEEYGTSVDGTRNIHSTGSVIWDQLLGGGFTDGTIVEVGGPPGIGKTTLVLATLKYLCDAGHKAAYLDFEGGVNHAQLEGIGLLPYWKSQFFLFQKRMKTIKDGEKVMDTIMKDPSVKFIVIDSDTEMKPSQLFEGSVEDVRPGVHAQYVANFLSKYKKLIIEHDKVLILISQVRMKLNFRGISTLEVSGGNGKKHTCDIRMQMKQISKVETNMNIMGEVKKTQIGADVEIWSTKNRLAPAFIRAPLRIIFGRGYHNGASLSVWLASHHDANGQKFLEASNNGRAVLHWGDRDIKFSSGAELDKWVNENVDDILRVVEERGGFELIEGAPEEEEGPLEYAEDLSDSSDDEVF